MRRDHVPPDDANDPLDAALGEMSDLVELEQRFAVLDASLQEAADAADRATPRGGSDDDPFSELEAVLREQRAKIEPVDDGGIDAREPDDALLDAPSRDEDDEDEASRTEDDELADEIEQRCQDALDALESDDPVLAREIAMAAVKLDDEHPFPMFVLGLVAERQGDLNMARDMAELALGTAGTNPDAIGLRAHIHVCQHEFDLADQLLRFGIAHNPDEAPLHEGLARVALARGRHSEALDSARAALRIEPGNPGAMAVRTAALDAGGDREALLAALRQGVQLHPEDPYAMVELASVEMEHGNLERARTLLARAQRLAPRDHEVGDVRALVEHVYDRRFLRPVPGLLRWMRDFPGGLAGFLLGFLVAGLPLQALAVSEPAYSVPAIAVLIAWGGVALYAWVAPAVLTHRLNQRAAHGGAERLFADLRDPGASMPSIDRIADVTSMLLMARARGQANELLSLAARRAESRGLALATNLDQLALELRRPTARIRSALLRIPGSVRGLIAIGAVLALSAPVLASTKTEISLVPWQAAACGCLLAAWFITVVDRAQLRDIDEAFTMIQMGTSTPAPTLDSRG